MGGSRWDAWLTKAIGRVAILSLVLHLIRMILTSSRSTMGEWSSNGFSTAQDLEGFSTAQDLEDFPTVVATVPRTMGDNDERRNNNDPINTSIMVMSGIHNNDTGNVTTAPQQKQNTSSDHLSSSTQPQQQQQQQPDVHAPTRVRRIPLEELINSQSNVTCDPAGKPWRRLIQSTLWPEALQFPQQSPHQNNSVHNDNSSGSSSRRRKIPNMVHVTSKTRCMTPPFRDNLDKWRFPGYGFYVHDEDAMDRLLAKYWPEFPHLQWIQQHCMITGAAKADLWRLLVLWEYGGIYTDIDNAPGPGFQNGTAIQGEQSLLQVLLCFFYVGAQENKAFPLFHPPETNSRTFEYSLSHGVFLSCCAVVNR
jgi:Glycosyltransferase sugar-binding region containing DXD motif